ERGPAHALGQSVPHRRRRRCGRLRGAFPRVDAGRAGPRGRRTCVAARPRPGLLVRAGRPLPRGRAAGTGQPLRRQYFRAPVGARSRAKALATGSPPGAREWPCGSALARESTRDKVDPTRTEGTRLRPKAFATKVAPTGARERPCPRGSALARESTRDKIAPTGTKGAHLRRRHSRPRSLPQGQGRPPVPESTRHQGRSHKDERSTPAPEGIRDQARSHRGGGVALWERACARMPGQLLEVAEQEIAIPRARTSRAYFKARALARLPC